MKNTLLICDDDEDILELCRTILEKDFRVVTTNNTENIQELIKAYNPNLVLMDLWIPQIGGDNATLILKQNKTTSNIPIVLFSANEEIESICKKVNADGFIKKPFSVKNMKEYIHEKINTSLN